ncbi:ShlB/FhaC/HecB family hemolysin secretion/activation protein [Pleurocapsales cyanobacterium LEGE 10410]|nr:ShlB/FhaC/HecB family hemolysin secretion/activation protein [Pleurocapsales cyanobacterium LEGE 10410]
MNQFSISWEILRQNTSRWKLRLYRTIIFSSWLSTFGQHLKIQRLKFLPGNWLFLTLLSDPGSAIAQPARPLTPDRPQLPQLQPLPAQPNPLNELDAPPIPESLLDIPGRIVVEKFEFTGNTVFSEAELRAAIADFTDRPISFAQLVQAAEAIGQLYLEQGYITSGAYIPAQNLASKAVQIQIVEGSLAEIVVNVEGNLTENYIRDRLTSKTSVPLNIDQLQERLQLLQLNPIIESLNAELSAGIKPGTNLLTVSVITADTFILQTRLNNNRNFSVGTFERGIELEEANLFGMGNKFRFAYHNTDGSNQYEGGYSLPLSSGDSSLNFNFRLTDNQILQSSFQKLDIDVKSRNYDLTWRQPVLRRATPTVTQELAISATASRRESNTTIFDDPTPLVPGANEDGAIRTSVLSFNQEWLQRSPRQVIFARSQFNFGLDVLNATIVEDEPNSQFFSWRGQLSYLRLLGTPQGIPAIGSTLLLRSELQLSADPLISTEQFSLGGAATVRGYRQDVLLTDNGFFAAAELRLPIARFSQINATLQFSPFVDFGTGWNTDSEEVEFSTLVGTGLGLLLQAEDRLSARVDWGTPLINRQTAGSSWQQDGVYLQLEYQLF